MDVQYIYIARKHPKIAAETLISTIILSITFTFILSKLVSAIPIIGMINKYAPKNTQYKFVSINPKVPIVVETKNSFILDNVLKYICRYFTGL